MRYLATGSIAQHPGSGRRTEITEDVKRIVDERVKVDNEMTAMQLHVLLVDLSYSLSLSTILCCGSTLRWTFRQNAYGQLIREANQIKRLESARKYKDNNFADVVFTDETTVQQESLHLFRCWKGVTPKSKPRYFIYQNIHSNKHAHVAKDYSDHSVFTCISYRPKHPTKVHVWAGLSM